MRERENEAATYSIKVNSSEPVRIFSKDGKLSAVVSKVPIIRPKPGPTANHEASHVAAAKKINKATIVPNMSAGYLGATWPVKMTPAVAAAAEAKGHKGTGWDKIVAERYLGVNWRSAIAQSNAELQGEDDFIDELAITMEEEKTIGQYHVDEARKRVTDRRQGIFPVRCEYYDKSGQKVKSISTVSRGGVVVISPN